MEILFNKNSKVALLLCGGDTNFSDLPIVTNKSNSMIPVNGKPVVGWILDDLVLKGVQEVIVVIRFDNYKLFNYIEWAFARRLVLHFAFVQPGGTILHSLLAGLAWVRPESGVHVILGDTLIRDPFPHNLDDFIFAGTFENSEDWCLVKTDRRGMAEQYFDKLKILDDQLQAVAGMYSFSDTTLLRNLVMAEIRKGNKEISHVLREYGIVREIAVITASEWYDFGHISYFNVARRRLLQSRYFNTLKIDPVRGTISKYSENKEKLADELFWYKSLPLHLQLLCPRILETQLTDDVMISQEYYGYPNLAELYVFGDIGGSVWTNALRRLMEIHQLFKIEKGSLDSGDILKMYGEKTLKRLEELSNQGESWKNLINRDILVVNGKKYVNFKGLTERVIDRVNKMASNFDACIIHGDYCFSNILYDLNSQLVRLIDPRGSFGEQKLYGDPRYDIAKLRHSISGRYDFILADLFWVSEDKNEFNMQIFKPEIYDFVCLYFDNLIEDHGYNKLDIMFIEGLLFVSMVPLHRDSFQRQLAMYLNGIMILNQVFR